MHFGRLGGASSSLRWAAAPARARLFLPWYGTGPDNPNAPIDGARGLLSAWEVHPIMRWLLLAAAAAPLILAWIIVRDTSCRGRAAS